MESFKETMALLHRTVRHRVSSHKEWVNSVLDGLPENTLAKDLSPEDLETLNDTQFIQDITVYVVKLARVLFCGMQPVPRWTKVARVLEIIESVCTAESLMLEDEARARLINNAVKFCASSFYHSLFKSVSGGVMQDTFNDTLSLLENLLSWEENVLDVKVDITNRSLLAHNVVNDTQESMKVLQEEMEKVFWLFIQDRVVHSRSKGASKYVPREPKNKYKEICDAIFYRLEDEYEKVDTQVFWFACRDAAKLKLPPSTNVPHVELSMDIAHFLRDQYLEQSEFVKALRDFGKLRV